MSFLYSQRSNPGDFYDRFGCVYPLIWGRTIHWGAFDSEPTTLDEAALNETRELAKLLEVHRRHHLLDLGCGAGASLVELATGTQVRATGVDLSEYQLAQAATAIDENGLGSRIKLIHADMCYLPFETASFDAVLSQAALFHVQDRPRAVSEIQRVLSQDGVLVFDDLLQSAELSPVEKELVFGRLGIAKLETIDSYCALLERSGFIVESALDRNNDLVETYAKVVAAFEKNEDRVSSLIGKSHVLQWKSSLIATLLCARQGTLTAGWFRALKR